MFSRRTLFKMAAYAALRSVDYTIGHANKLPEIPFADSLVDVLLLLKTKTRMVCLGDTNHSNPRLKMFLSSLPHMERLGLGGYDNVFVEQSTDSQQLFSQLQNKQCLPEEVDEELFRTMWLPDAQINAFNKKYANSLYNLKSPLFHAVDTRDSSNIKISLAGNILMCIGDLLHNLLFPYSTATGYWYFPMFALEGDASENNNTFLQSILNDEKTAKEIVGIMGRCHNAGLVVYGEGHFNGTAETLGVKSMHQCLMENQLPPLRVSLYYSSKEREENHMDLTKSFGKHFRPADIDFIDNDTAAPEIIFNNKALQDDYKRYVTRKNRTTSIATRTYISQQLT